jgi:hypothetical protein
METAQMYLDEMIRIYNNGGYGPVVDYFCHEELFCNEDEFAVLHYTFQEFIKEYAENVR